MHQEEFNEFRDYQILRKRIFICKYCATPGILYHLDNVLFHNDGSQHICRGLHEIINSHDNNGSIYYKLNGLILEHDFVLAAQIDFTAAPAPAPAPAPAHRIVWNTTGSTTSGTDYGLLIQVNHD